MNDVKITEQDGTLWVKRSSDHRGHNIPEWEVAALREHFAAEQQDAIREIADGLLELHAPVRDRADDGDYQSMPLVCSTCDVPYPCLTARIATNAQSAVEQPATPTPSTEQIAAAAAKYMYGDTYEARAARGDFVAGARWALVSPVSEQPTQLDPEPWESPFTDLRSRRQINPNWSFKPRPEFEQDRGRYQ